MHEEEASLSEGGGADQSSPAAPPERLGGPLPYVAGGFLLGIFFGNPFLLFGIPIAVVGTVVVVAFLARRQVAQAARWMLGTGAAVVPGAFFALQRGLTMSPEFSLLARFNFAVVTTALAAVMLMGGAVLLKRVKRKPIQAVEVEAPSATPLILTVPARALVFLAASAAAASPGVFLAALVAKSEDWLVLLLPFLALSGLLAAFLTTGMTNLLIRQHVGIFLRRVLLYAEVGGLFLGIFGFFVLTWGLRLLVQDTSSPLKLLLAFVVVGGVSTFATRRGYPKEIPTPPRVGASKGAAALAAVAVLIFGFIAALGLPDLFP